MTSILFSTSISVDFQVAYESAYETAYANIRQFIVAGYNKSVMWIKKNGSWAYAKLAEICALAKAHLIRSYEVGKAYVLTHKKWVIIGTAISIALLILYCLWKNRPQHQDLDFESEESMSNFAPSPIVISKKIEKSQKEVTQTPIIKMETTLNIAKLTVAVPKEKRPIPNVSLTFCVDLSSSMRGDREKEVKRAVNKVLDSAQRVINALKETEIGIAIVGFNQQSTVITPAIKLIPHDKLNKDHLLTRIKQQVASMFSTGGTSIISGLEGAMQELEKMVDDNPASTPTLILLTDGEDSISAYQLTSIQARFAAAKVNVYAIGIGDYHNKQTLKEIITYHSNKFKGTYIDTTLGEETIESAIDKIYHQAIASYRDLILTSTQLGNAWNLVGIASTFFIENGQYKINLGSISEEEKFFKVIRICPEKLSTPLDLSKVTFELSYKDPKGRLGNIALPWKPNTTIDPIIATAVSK